MFLLHFFLPLGAQHRVWTMDDCMRYAVEHNFDVQAGEIEYSTLRSDYKSSIASFFPTFSDSVGADYNFGRSIDPATNTYDNLKTFNNSYGVSSSWTLFSGGRIINSFREARMRMRQQVHNLQNIKDETALAVMEAYVNLQYYRALSKITAAKLDESRRLLEKSLRMKELGLNSALEVSQARAQYADDDHVHTVTTGEMQTAMLSLKNAMNYPLSDTLVLPEPVAVAPTSALSGGIGEVDTILDFASRNNPVMLQAQFNVDASRYAVRQARGAFIPTISLQAGLSDYYYRHFGSRSENFREQMNGNFGQYVGVSMSIPLFNGLSRNNTLKRARNAESSARSDYQRALYELDIQIRQAVADYDNLVKECGKMGKKTESDSVAYHLAGRKYEEGLMSFTDMQQAYNTWYESQAELVRVSLMLEVKRRLLEYYRTNMLILG